jgi:hypothetical protein
LLEKRSEPVPSRSVKPGGGQVRGEVDEAPCSGRSEPAPAPRRQVLATFDLFDRNQPQPLQLACPEFSGSQKLANSGLRDTEPFRGFRYRQQANRSIWRRLKHCVYIIVAATGGGQAEGNHDADTSERRLSRDYLCLPSGAVELIDYKSGSATSPEAAEASLQLSIYALACRNALDLGRPERVTLYCLDESRRSSAERTDAALDALRTDLAARARAIRGSDFAPTPSPRSCGWCDFAVGCPASGRRTDDLAFGRKGRQAANGPPACAPSSTSGVRTEPKRRDHRDRRLSDPGQLHRPMTMGLCLTTLPRTAGATPVLAQRLEDGMGLNQWAVAQEDDRHQEQDQSYRL